jgi:hypothetical protein
MDFAKYNTVEAVQAYVDLQPLNVKQLLNVPWLAGTKSYLLDTNLVQAHLDSLQPDAQINLSIINSTIASRNDPFQSNSTSRIVVPNIATETAQEDAINETEDCHILIPFSSMKDWISSTMNCRVCRSGVKATYISKSTVGIASQLHFNCGSEKCKARKKNNDGSRDRSFTR